MRCMPSMCAPDAWGLCAQGMGPVRRAQTKDEGRRRENPQTKIKTNPGEQSVCRVRELDFLPEASSLRGQAPCTPVAQRPYIPVQPGMFNWRRDPPPARLQTDISAEGPSARNKSVHSPVRRTNGSHTRLASRLSAFRSYKPHHRGFKVLPAGECYASPRMRSTGRTQRREALPSISAWPAASQRFRLAPRMASFISESESNN
jgi:hypothetical protein